PAVSSRSLSFVWRLFAEGLAHSSGSARSKSRKSASALKYYWLRGWFRESSADSRALNQFHAVTGRINRDAYHDACVSERARFAGHRAAGRLDRGDGLRHVFHVQNHVRNRIPQVVGIAMRDYDRLAFVGLR